MKNKLILVVVLAGTILGFAGRAKADMPNGAACPVSEGYLLLCFRYGACIMPDCSSDEFDTQENNDWLDEWYYPNDGMGYPVELGW